MEVGERSSLLGWELLSIRDLKGKGLDFDPFFGIRILNDYFIIISNLIS